MLSEDVVRLLPEIPHRSHHQQQSERQEQIEATLSYEPSSGDLWLKAYGGDILEYLQSFYPPEMKEEKIRKD
ncbi:hypothetical protein FACS1894176_00470 [Bacteroidia bacterium]|nr:hypothetical protein FACS1894176_00470 [Bacteroidia bacterium]